MESIESIINNPADALLYFKRAKLHRKSGRIEAALSDYNEAIRLNSGYPSALYNRGNIYRDLKQYGNAIGDYTKAIEIERDFAEAYINRALCLEATGKIPEALIDYTIAIHLDGNNALAFYNRGNAFFKVRSYEGYVAAIDDYSDALFIESLPQALHNRALAKSMLGKYKDSVADLTKVISLSPDNAGSYACRARSYSKLGLYAAAISDYSKAVALGLDNHDILEEQEDCFDTMIHSEIRTLS